MPAINRGIEENGVERSARTCRSLTVSTSYKKCMIVPQ